MKLQLPKPELPKIGKPKFGKAIPKFDLKAFMKLPRKEKERYIALTVLLPATVLFFIYGIFTNASTPDTPTQKHPPAATQTAENIAEPQPMLQEVDNGQKGSVLSQNPFVESSKLAMMDMGDFQPSMPMPSMGMGDLPSIPSSPSYLPRPSVTASLPAIPRANTPTPSVPKPPAPQKQENQATVSGVLTGEDGNNMAIMSDGKVVSEGDSYNGNRIAYIGGDGIKFDNGHAIGYK